MTTPWYTTSEFTEKELIKIEEKRISQEEQYKIEEIKTAYGLEIYTRYSQTDQANMTARASEIAIESKWREYTLEEVDDIEIAKTMITWIREKRKECEKDILALN